MQGVIAHKSFPSGTKPESSKEDIKSWEYCNLIDTGVGKVALEQCDNRLVDRTQHSSYRKFFNATTFPAQSLVGRVGQSNRYLIRSLTDNFKAVSD